MNLKATLARHRKPILAGGVAIAAGAGYVAHRRGGSRSSAVASSPGTKAGPTGTPTYDSTAADVYGALEGGLVTLGSRLDAFGSAYETGISGINSRIDALTATQQNVPSLYPTMPNEPAPVATIQPATDPYASSYYTSGTSTPAAPAKRWEEMTQAEKNAHMASPQGQAELAEKKRRGGHW